MEFRPGDMLKGTPYRVVRQIGAGGMGAVHEVEHVRLEKRYVAKTLHPGMLTRKDLVKRMEREAKILARIAHPNLVDVHDLGVTEDGFPYFVMDKLEGTDLRRLLRVRRFLSVRDALTVMEDVLEALAHAHREGVIHRDLKPENVFLAKSGAETRTKLLDFGIVHLLDDENGLTGDRFIGTYQYASPEQINGEKPTERSDLYSVGCMLFEMLAGRLPFIARDPSGYIEAHTKHKPPALAELLPEIPVELSLLVAQLLEKDPKNRPDNALKVARRLHIVKQHVRDIAVADACTTEETLLTAVTQGATDSAKIAAAQAVHDTDVDTDRGMPYADRSDTSKDSAPPAPSPDLLLEGLALKTTPDAPQARDFRAAATRTGELPPHVPTEPIDTSATPNEEPVTTSAPSARSNAGPSPARVPRHVLAAAALIVVTLTVMTAVRLVGKPHAATVEPRRTSEPPVSSPVWAPPDSVPTSASPISSSENGTPRAQSSVAAKAEPRRSPAAKPSASTSAPQKSDVSLGF
jgi:serine/threonine-protein kinase